MRVHPIITLLLTVLIWASSFAFIKLVVTDVSPYVLAVLRAVIGAIFLVSIVVLTRQTKKFIEDIYSRWKIYFLLGFISIAIFDVLQNVGISYTSSSLAGVLLNTNPLFIALLSIIFLKEKITKYRVMGLFTGFIGMCIVVIGDEDISVIITSQAFLGNVFILLSAITWAIYSVVNKQILKNTTPLFVATATSVFGAIFLIPIVFVNNIFLSVDALSWLIIIYLGVVASGLTFFLWSYTLSKMEASRASLFLFLIPIISVIIGWIFLDEKVNIYMLFGGILVIFGIFIAENKLKSD